MNRIKRQTVDRFLSHLIRIEFARLNPIELCMTQMHEFCLETSFESASLALTARNADVFINWRLLCYDFYINWFSIRLETGLRIALRNTFSNFDPCNDTYIVILINCYFFHRYENSCDKMICYFVKLQVAAILYEAFEPSSLWTNVSSSFFFNLGS